jgi:AraC-like DNA-binding protein
MDERFAFRLETVDSCELVLVRMPRQAVLAQHPHLKNHTATALSAGTPGTDFLRETVLNMLRGVSRLSSEHRTTAVATLIQLMGMADFEAVGAAAPPAHARIRKALSFVELSLFESGLRAEAIAAAQGVSRRRLDSLFLAALGVTVSTHVWNRRLTLAASFLRQARHADQTIAQIAYAVGFADPAHFARMFKRRFGCSPRLWRQGNQAVEERPAREPAPEDSTRCAPRSKRSGPRLRGQ